MTIRDIVYNTSAITVNADVIVKRKGKLAYDTARNGWRGLIFNDNLLNLKIETISAKDDKVVFEC